MPWYIHVYHIAWLLTLLSIGYFFSWFAALAILSSIVILAIWKA